MGELKPAMQLRQREDGVQEVVYFKVMTEDEIEKANQGSIPKKFDRIENGETIFIWTGEKPFNIEIKQPTEEEISRERAREMDAQRSAKVRARLHRRR